MKRMIVTMFGVGVLTLGLVAPAGAATSGDWAQYPTGTSLYSAEIQQPINSANTSNWSSKSKGGIPVMFKLFEKPGPAVFESIWSNGNEAFPGTDDFAFVSYTLDTPIALNEVTHLSTVYHFDTGNCHGGSLRWDIWLKDGSGNFRPISVYYGDPRNVSPSFQSCTGTYDESGMNLMDMTNASLPANRFELRDQSWGYPGPIYTTWDEVLAFTNGGNDLVYGFQLTIDSGWGGDQAATISDTMVNDQVYQWQSGDGTPTQTCDPPDATIRVTSITGTPTGSVNEEPVQSSLADSGNLFRVIDCKYQYVLSIPSLHGPGRYQAEILIGSVVGETFFDLR